MLSFARRCLWLPVWWVALLGLGGCAPTPGGATVAAETPTAVAVVPSPTASATNAPSRTPSPAPSLTSTAASTATPTATPTPRPTPIPTPTPEPPADLALTADSLRLYPLGPYYAGDLITIEVLPHRPAEVNSWELEVAVAVADRPLEQRPDHAFTFNGDFLWRFPWVWDTTGLVGEYTLSVVVDPDDRIQIGDEDLDNNSLAWTVTVLPDARRPPAERAAQWVARDGRGVRLFAVQGTAAARDLPMLTAEAERAMQAAAERLQLPLPDDLQLQVYLVERILGQGGYAYGNSTYVISYSDRQYTSAALYQILLHETTHVLENRDLTPNGGVSFLTEGLAVWAAGGHYKPEDLPRRAAALLETGLYIPFETLIPDFYRNQHEIGYLQAGAFVAWLVETEGWPALLGFLGHTNIAGGEQAAIVEEAAQAQFGRTTAELEAAWLDWLRALPPDPEMDWAADLLTTIRLYELLRAYQSRYDRLANYLYGWLMPPDAARERGAVFDFVRRPAEPIHQTLETMLAAAQQALLDGRLHEVAWLLDGVEAALADPETAVQPYADYRAVVEAVVAAGYETRQIALDGDTAVVLAAPLIDAAPPTRVTLTASRTAEGWRFSR